MPTEILGTALTLQYINEEMDGPEDLKLRRQMAEGIILRVLNQTAVEKNMALGPVRYEEQIHQDHGPMLVGEADVIFVHSRPKLTDQLSRDDITALRAATRRAKRQAGQGEPMTDAECDEMINAIGPDVIEKMLKASVVQ